jgi:hypothetical protein
MNLINFDLVQPSYAIGLNGLGVVWDLPNAGEFLGLDLNSSKNSILLKWRMSGHTSSQYSGCHLLFSGLKLMYISSRDQELPQSEDLTVAGISMVTPEISKDLAYRVRRQWSPDDPFHLVFEFQSRRYIELDAETVELIGVPQ